MLCYANMHPVWRTAAGLCCAASLFAPRLFAQPSPPPATPEPPSAPESALQAPEAPPPPVAGSPESLETPYTDTAPRAVPAMPPRRGRVEVAPQPTPDTRPLAPIRDRRKLALLGELGWNGLAGFGAILTYNAHPNIALDLAGGFSLLGWKAGVRGRYNFLKSAMTPFVGVGFNATSGLGEFSSDPKNNPDAPADSKPFTVNVKASYLVQYTIGFDFIHKHGFTMQGALGYAQLLNKDNWVLVDGSMTRNEKRGFDIAFKGGPVISLAWGYAFE
jgi:hypothetical protein